MVSLWGSKQNDGEETERPSSASAGGESAGTRSAVHDEQPHADERAPLLPRERQPRPHADGFLDPDDPAVSPYNLWTVRFVRYITVLFLTITFVWWVLLLVSIFVSPPGLATRGSGFFDFSYTTLTSGFLLLTLLFFTAPSKAMRVLLGVLSLLLLVNMLIIVTIPRLRQEESWPGIASIVWATVMGIWCIFVDRIVAWGKQEEEERLTGRVETRRSVKEWLAVLFATTLLTIYTVIVVFITATLILRARDSTLEMDGRRVYVDADKYQVHLACFGNSSTDAAGNKLPTVLLEAGENVVEYEFEPWARSALSNGTIDRYCWWDRPGYGWSDNAPSPHSAGMSADALSEALAVEGEEGPWLLVSAGYGSIVSRIFASRHPRGITGLLLIDPLHEDLLYRLSTPGRGFILWAYGIISPLGIDRVLGALFKGRTREDRVYGRSAYQGGKFIKAQLQENLIADSLTKSEVQSARIIQSPDTPVAIVSSGISVRRDSDWEKKQRDLTHLTDKLVSWDVVQKAPHEVWKTLEGRRVMEKRLGELYKFKALA